jgi:hypothetical protein
LNGCVNPLEFILEFFHLALCDLHLVITSLHLAVDAINLAVDAIHLAVLALHLSLEVFNIAWLLHVAFLLAGSRKRKEWLYFYTATKRRRWEKETNS